MHGHLVAGGLPVPGCLLGLLLLGLLLPAFLVGLFLCPEPLQLGIVLGHLLVGQLLPDLDVLLVLGSLVAESHFLGYLVDHLSLEGSGVVDGQFPTHLLEDLLKVALD